MAVVSSSALSCWEEVLSRLLPTLLTLSKYFWAWERIWEPERVPTNFEISFQFLP